jgi:hypothetical protein
VNRKVVDLTALYNFYKGYRAFFSSDFAQSAAKLWMSPCSSEQELLAVDQVFHPFPLKIWNVPRRTGQLSYWEILKYLGEIWRTRQKFRRTFIDIRGFSGVWPCLWPKFDHKGVLTWSRGSLGVVSSVFEVMIQVDLGLTNVSRFDSAESAISVNDAN